MIYLKKVINQDLERTPTFNVEAVHDFFKIMLENGESVIKKIILIPDLFEIDVRFQRRETRGEYRIFLNLLFERTNPIEGDVLLFRQKNKESFFCQHISKQDVSYFYYNQLFEEQKNHQLVILETPPNDQILIFNDFFGFSKLADLYYNSLLEKRFTASLLTKPFVILTGLSGSGKTKLAQAFVTWISALPTQFCLVPVGADWTNREPLLGYPNGLDEEKYSAPDCGSLQLIIRATEDPTRPYFLILDEMNLSHVERYFADFLSVMESQDKIRLYSGGQRQIPAINENEDPLKVPQEIGWPKNLFIIGTVNIDETTYMFSPKVLDRANVIEFRVSADDMDKFLQKPVKPDLLNLLEDRENPYKGGRGKGMAQSFMDLAIDKKIQAPTDEKLVTTLNGFFSELQKAGAEFGYRSASEMLLLMINLEKVRLKNEKESADDLEKIREEHLDIAIMQKLLPKLHGSRNKLTKVLETLACFCYAEGADSKKVKSEFLDPFSKNEKTEIDFEGDKIRFKISFLKLCRMYKAAMENGYASYAEA